MLPGRILWYDAFTKEWNMLEIKNLTKSYGDLLALDHFSLTLEKGEVLGLLGPNGAGKTTLISILAGTVRDFTGSVRFLGHDLFSDRNLKNHFRIVPPGHGFLRGAERHGQPLGRTLRRSARQREKRAAEILERVELSGRMKEPVKNFSGGMKRRLNTAIGLLHRPDLLLLDEPTVGIDVQAKVSILDLIRKVGAEGTGVIFTTHQLAEVENTCSRIAIMDCGRILAQGTMEELIRLVGEKDIVEITGNFPAASFTEALQDLDGNGIELLSAADNLATLAVADTEQIPKTMDRLFRRKLAVTDLKIKTPSLETVFLKLTGRSLRD